jgi:hypothetical protein
MPIDRMAVEGGVSPAVSTTAGSETPFGNLESLVGRTFRYGNAVVTVHRPLPTRLEVVPVIDIPEKPTAGILYLVGEADHVWFVVLSCPCGCGATICLNLLPDDSPRWALTEGPTLTPSIMRTSGCRSHFYIRNGEIIWCDTRQSEPGPRR